MVSISMFATDIEETEMEDVDHLSDMPALEHEDTSNGASGLAPAPAAREQAHDDADGEEESEESVDDYDDMTDGELRLACKEVCARLIKEGIVVSEPIIWNGECGPEEVRASEMAGFLYTMYKVEYWWWECLEMVRKLIINGVLVHVNNDDIRLAIGFSVCFLSLLLSFSARPFASPKLNHLLLSGLSIQTLTLAYGLLLIVKGKVRGDTATSANEMKALEWVVTLVSCYSAARCLRKGERESLREKF